MKHFNFECNLFLIEANITRKDLDECGLVLVDMVIINFVESAHI